MSPIHCNYNIISVCDYLCTYTSFRMFTFRDVSFPHFCEDYKKTFYLRNLCIPTRENNTPYQLLELTCVIADRLRSAKTRYDCCETTTTLITCNFATL